MMMEQVQKPVEFTEKFEGFNVSVKVDKPNPDAHRLQIELTHDEKGLKFTGSYLYNQLDKGVHTLFENLDQLRESLYKLIKDKDERLNIRENGTIRIGYMQPLSKSYKYIDIPTEKQGVQHDGEINEGNERSEKEYVRDPASFKG